MSIVSVLEQFTDRQGSGDFKAKREYTRMFKVIANSLVDDVITISGAVGIPRIFDPYVGSDGLVDPIGALCFEVAPHCVGEFEWMVTCKYSNRCDWPDLGQLDPLLRPSEISWSSVEATRAGERDTKGKAYVNSAGEKFKPPVEVADGRLAVVIRRNEAGYDPNLGQTYHEAVNSDSFYGAAPGYAMCKGITAERHYENHIFYWAVTYTIHFKNVARTGWQPLVLDQGFYFKDPVTGKIKQALDVYGQPLSSPTLLDGQGGLLSAATSTLGATGMDAATTRMAVAGTDPAWLAKAAFPINVLVDSELMTVTRMDPTGDRFIVVRGAGSTTAAAHAGGATVALQPVFLPFNEYPSLPFGALHLP